MECRDRPAAGARPGDAPGAVMGGCATIESVMARFDPIRADLGASLPGLTRQSIFFAKSLLSKWMDARVKPGHDGLSNLPKRDNDAGSTQPVDADSKRPS